MCCASLKSMIFLVQLAIQGISSWNFAHMHITSSYTCVCVFRIFWKWNILFFYFLKLKSSWSLVFKMPYLFVWMYFHMDPLVRVRPAASVRWETVRLALSKSPQPSIGHPTVARGTYRVAGCHCLWAVELQMDMPRASGCSKVIVPCWTCRFHAFALSVAFLSRSACGERQIIVIPGCALGAAVFRLANPSWNSSKSGLKILQLPVQISVFPLFFWILAIVLSSILSVRLAWICVAHLQYNSSRFYFSFSPYGLFLLWYSGLGFDGRSAAHEVKRLTVLWLVTFLRLANGGQSGLRPPESGEGDVQVRRIHTYRGSVLLSSWAKASTGPCVHATNRRVRAPAT